MISFSRRTALSIAALCVATHAVRAAPATAVDVGLRRVGTVRTRPAREIASSTWSVGAETMDRDFTVYRHWRAHLGPLGVKKARIQAGWAKTERTPRRYDWRWLDEIIVDMTRQGVEPWVCLCYGNPIHEGGGGTGLGDGMPTSAPALAAWDRFVAGFVTRYKRYVDEWEIWNEPGLRGANSSRAYARFYLRTARVIRARQPDAKLLACGMAGIKVGLAKAVLEHLKRNDALEFVDFVTYHPYSYNPDASYGAVAKLRKAVKGFSPRIDVRQGENGAPSRRGSFGALSNNDWTETSQAKWALRRLMGDHARGIETSLFSICDMHYTSRRNYKGILATNADKTVHHRKEAWYAFRNLTAVFDATAKRTPEVTCTVDAGTAAGAHQAWAFRADGGDGGAILAVWRSTDTPGKHPDVRRVRLAVRGARIGDPVWVDLLSGAVCEFPVGSWRIEGDATVFDAVPAYDSVVLVAEASAIPIARGR